ncbi:EF-P 5-aminopentanol modification-associated protein YfmH [Chryseomicrobium palamuruense]|uniref:EF-P 5-aminopentanol modification-associated protein YfmH n=1 Tax=Chryseomicrobium palamuruense TaxID=682973 RepID=A0ABV8UV93_9BACL
MEHLHFEQLNESLYYEKMENGLEVYVLPKNGFSKSYVTFTTKYGSIDNHFIPPGQQEVRVPDGIAHFLEHKMFEKEDGDVFQKFSEEGASANAFTSFTRTAYLFSATENIENHTKTLIDFVQIPYFTEATVNKEKGIIAQEITMYDDMPDWRLYFGAIENMYHHHPVKIDIAGTVDSIQEITAEHLYLCHQTFYHPSNMVLFAVGAVEPDAFMELVRKNQESKHFTDKPEVQHLLPEEPDHVAVPYRELQMDVVQPKVIYGIKAPVHQLTGNDMLKYELAMQVTIDILFGRASAFYSTAYENGFIDESYSADFSMESSYGFSMIGSDTDKPQELIKAIRHFLTTPFEEFNQVTDQLERTKKRKIGTFLRALNSIEYIANQFTRYRLNEMDLFQVLPVLESLTIDDLKAAYSQLQSTDAHTQFVILPNGKK